MRISEIKNNETEEKEPIGQAPDPRFKSQKFRESVRFVLQNLGIDSPVMGDIREYEESHDRQVDWKWLADCVRAEQTFADQPTIEYCPVKQDWKLIKTKEICNE